MRKVLFLVLVLSSGYVFGGDSRSNDGEPGFDYTANFEWHPESSWGVGFGLVGGLLTRQDRYGGTSDIAGAILEGMYFDKDIWSLRMGLALLRLTKQWMGTSGITLVAGYYWNSPTPHGADLNITFVNVAVILSARAKPNSPLTFHSVGIGYRL